MFLLICESDSSFYVYVSFGMHGDGACLLML